MYYIFILEGGENYMKKMKKNLVLAIEYSLQNPTVSATKVSQMFGVERHSLSKYKKDYLLYKYDNKNNPDDEYLYYFSDEELEFINAYLNNPDIPYNELKKIYPNSPERRALYRWIDILGYQKTQGGAIKYHYDRNKFKTIETEEDAYWLGFITADGCIIENKWLQIQLASKDKNHLIKFCSFMGLSHEETEEIIKDGFGGAYTKDNPINNIKICSLDIINHLYEKKVFARKSGKEIPYICKTKELELAYIRGLIDGDGYIGSTQYRMGIVGSKEMCEYVKNFIIKNIYDISSNTIREHGTIYKLEINGKIQTSIILKALYENANIYLDRKYKLYMEQYV